MVILYGEIHIFLYKKSHSPKSYKIPSISSLMDSHENNRRYFNKPSPSAIFEKFVLAMVTYFIVSIVHSLAQNYRKRLQSEKKSKHSD